MDFLRQKRDPPPYSVNNLDVLKTSWHEAKDHRGPGASGKLELSRGFSALSRRPQCSCRPWKTRSLKNGSFPKGKAPRLANLTREFLRKMLTVIKRNALSHAHRPIRDGTRTLVRFLVNPNTVGPRAVYITKRGAASFLPRAPWKDNSYRIDIEEAQHSTGQPLTRKVYRRCRRPITTCSRVGSPRIRAVFGCSTGGSRTRFV